MVVCKQCKYKNTLDRVFCMQCGAKLDIETAAMLAQADARLALFKKRAIRFLLLDAVILALVLMVLAYWPSGDKPEPAGDKEFLAAKAKVIELDNGRGTPITFSEVEINALIAERLKKTFKEKKKNLDVRVAPGAVRVTLRSGLGPWNLGTFSVGPMPFTYSVTGMPTHKNGRFLFEPYSGAVGHLPLWGWFMRKISAPIAEMFEDMQHMRAFMDRVEDFEVGDGKVTLRMETRQQ